MQKETEKQTLQLPKFSTCRVCRYFLSEYCDPCMGEANGTYFQLRKGVSFFDMPPFPSVPFNDGMPVKMRQAVVGAYMEKIVEVLQGGK